MFPYLCPQMKILFAIAASLLLYLTAMPCDDYAALGSWQNHEHTSQEDHSDLPVPDDCSPFCICQCCHIPINLDIHITELMPLSNTALNEDMTGEDIVPQNIMHSIWHPPRFV